MAMKLDNKTAYMIYRALQECQYHLYDGKRPLKDTLTPGKKATVYTHICYAVDATSLPQEYKRVARNYILECLNNNMDKAKAKFYNAFGSPAGTVVSLDHWLRLKGIINLNYTRNNVERLQKFRHDWVNKMMMDMLPAANKFVEEQENEDS